MILLRGSSSCHGDERAEDVVLGGRHHVWVDKAPQIHRSQVVGVGVRGSELGSEALGRDKVF